MRKYFIKKKQTVMALALTTLWAALATGCGAGRQGMPGQSREDESEAGPATRMEASVTDQGKGGEASAPVIAGGAENPAATREAMAGRETICLPEADILKERLRVNEERSARWTAVGSLLASSGAALPDGWQRCSRLLQEMVSGYKKLLTASESLPARHAVTASAQEEAEPFGPFVQEILFQEKRCENTIFDAGVSIMVGAVPLKSWGIPFTVLDGWPLSARTRLLHARALAETGDSQGSVALLQNFPNDTLSPEELVEHSRLLADSLLVSGRHEEAAAAYQRLLREVENAGKLQNWARAHTDILLRAREDMEAFHLYQSVLQASLASSASGREEALRRLETDFPKSSVTAIAVTIHRGHSPENGSLPGEDATASPSSPESAGLAPLPTLTEEQAARWEEALKLLHLKRYDEAMALFSLLHNTPFAVQAKAKLREASTQAATELRQQAAAAFSSARKASGRTEQQALLLQSKKMLETILSRYPEAEIREKVVQNLREVDRQLSAPRGSSSGVHSGNQAN